jgi:hypothetical protein
MSEQYISFMPCHFYNHIFLIRRKKISFRHEVSCITENFYISAKLYLHGHLACLEHPAQKSGLSHLTVCLTRPLMNPKYCQVVLLMQLTKQGTTNTLTLCGLASYYSFDPTRLALLSTLENMSKWLCCQWMPSHLSHKSFVVRPDVKSSSAGLC